MKRRHCYEVDERILARGEVYRALDTDRVRAIAREIKAHGRVEAVAINFLFSFVTPDHERAAQAIFAEECPGLPVSISYEVLPKWKEFERSSTTITDAYIKPVVGRHLGTMRARLDEKGITRQVAAIKSNGGEMTLEEAARHPIQMTLSGPTGGVVGAKQIARSAGVDHLVTLDMGGTSTDVSTVVGGQESFTTSFEIEFGLPIQIPMIDIRTMGAGGGSLAWIDKGGMLRMGPESAGANPGARLLRPRRHPGDRDRRQPRTRPHQSRELPRRCHGARPGCRRVGDRCGRKRHRQAGRRDRARHGADRQQQHDRPRCARC